MLTHGFGIEMGVIREASKLDIPRKGNSWQKAGDWMVKDIKYGQNLRKIAQVQ